MKRKDKDFTFPDRHNNEVSDLVPFTNSRRTFSFTHEQADHIIHALHMASNAYNDQFKSVCQTFPDEPQELKMYWLNKANMYYDLSEDLKAWNFDI